MLLNLDLFIYCTILVIFTHRKGAVKPLMFYFYYLSYLSFYLFYLDFLYFKSIFTISYHMISTTLTSMTHNPQNPITNHKSKKYTYVAIVSILIKQVLIISPHTPQTSSVDLKYIKIQPNPSNPSC